MALIELFLGAGTQQGLPHSIEIEDVYQSYNAIYQRFNQLINGTYKVKIANKRWNYVPLKEASFLGEKPIEP